MNYDEMPAGAKMDLLVAEKVMGWKPAKQPATRYSAQVINKWGQPIYDVDNVGRGYDAFEEVVFRPSVDIAHAWEVIDRLHGRGPLIRTRELGGWVASFSITYPNGLLGCVYGEADTAPHAICRAALKAMNQPRPTGRESE